MPVRISGLPAAPFSSRVKNQATREFAGSPKTFDMRLSFFVTGILSLLLFNARQVCAQEGGTLPGARYITDIPFRLLDGGIILAEIRIASFPDPLNFVFDTGCGGISLDSTTAVRFHLDPRASDQIVRGIGGIRRQRLVTGLNIKLGDLVIDSLTAQVTDYDILSSIYGEKIDGILGYSFFSRYLVKIDYDKERISVYENGNIRYPKGGWLLKPRLSWLPVADGHMNEARDVDSRLYFDTGAGLCLLVSADFAADSAIFGGKKKPPVMTQTAGMGGKADMQLTTLKNFKLGPYRFKQIPVYIYADSFDAIHYPQLHGLLGNDLLRRFNVILNYARSEIYLMPNKSFRQPFDYGYSGVMISRIDGKIQVTDVVKDSPGGRAGLQAGDIILSIDGDDRQDMQAYQALLRTTGSRIKVKVNRPGSGDKRIMLKVESIL
jgi:hypothetical protein